MELNIPYIIRILGGATNVSKMVGTSVAAVSMWQKTGIPKDKLVILAATIEEKTFGVISRKNLFPKNYGEIWPELE